MQGDGGRGRIRTPDLSVRSRMLYPTELRALRNVVAEPGFAKAADHPSALRDRQASRRAGPPVSLS